MTRTDLLEINRTLDLTDDLVSSRSRHMISGVLRFPRAGHIFLLAPLLLCLCPAAHAKRKDVVIMNNGDHFTGEVKRLQNGLLYVETDYVSGNIGLDWNQVQCVQSTATYRIVLNNGKRLEGKIEKDSSDKAKTEDFLIREATEVTQVPSAEIVSIDSRKPTFWRQLQGSMDLGYSFTSGNSQTTLNADTGAAYKTPGWEAAISFDSTFSGQSGSSNTNREDLQTVFTKFLNRNSFVSGLSDFLHSSQQDLKLRTTLGGGYGRYLKRTTNSSLAWLGGVVYIHESFGTIAGNPSDQNIEAVVGLQYNYIRFNFGEFNSQVRVFPGLTDAGRVRLTTNNSLTIKLRNNFHLAFTLWDNFDSQPPVTAKKNELGISSGIGWSF
jgi:putative salt-induced outer membrane protein YdiY